MIHYGKHRIFEADIRSVVDVLRSDFLTQGPVVGKFEEALAQAVGARHAVAANSATSALHLACLALGVGPDDIVWTSPNSFVASANCASYCGASVDFVDIDPHTLCMDHRQLEGKLAQCRISGKKLPKVVIPVHFAGHTCNMPEIKRLGEEFGFRILEDASHAIGTRVMNPGTGNTLPVGACSHSDICVFSLHPVKIITSGEGGVAVTNDPDLAEKLALLRTHGVVRDLESLERSDEPWRYEMHALGFNYRMTDIQAALGLSQLQRLSAFVERRQLLAARYRDKLSRVLPREEKPRVISQACPPDCLSSYHLMVVHVPNSSSRMRCYLALKAAGFLPGVHYLPIHLHPYYRERGFGEGNFPIAESHYEKTLSLPLYPALEEEVVDAVCAVLLENASAPQL
jgi:UDP-4-amino-4,6-dideoxy-N-acetyl-beta-L-altrosamine transaminase